MLGVACAKKYDDIKTVATLLEMVRSGSSITPQETMIAGLFQVAVMDSNPQFDPEELGFRVTTLTS
jgi:hypothetical protein